jgi:hypothetical protein
MAEAERFPTHAGETRDDVFGRWSDGYPPFRLISGLS